LIIGTSLVTGKRLSYSTSPANGVYTPPSSMLRLFGAHRTTLITIYSAVDISDRMFVDVHGIWYHFYSSARYTTWREGLCCRWLLILHIPQHSKSFTWFITPKAIYHRFGSGWLLHNKCPPDASDLMLLYVAPQPFNKFVSANCQHNVAPLQSYWCGRIHHQNYTTTFRPCQQRQAIVHHVKESDVEDEGIEILLLLFAINVTDVCPGTAFMLTSATVQRQRLTIDRSPGRIYIIRWA